MVAVMMMMMMMLLPAVAMYVQGATLLAVLKILNHNVVRRRVDAE